MPASLSDGHAKKRINNNGKELKINFLRQLFFQQSFFFPLNARKLNLSFGKRVSRVHFFDCFQNE